MQYHFVVGFDTDSNRWWVEGDPTSYFPDGSIWDGDRVNWGDYGFHGWFIPEEDSAEEKIDIALYRALESAMDSIPVPTEV